MLFPYKAYELGIHSEVQLYGPSAAIDTPAEVVIQRRKISECHELSCRNGTVFLGETPGVGVFLVRLGKEIVIDPIPGVDESLLSTLLLGPIMAVLLRQRGLAVLHASSIATDRGAVAFLGDSGCGKSTLAGAFHAQGYGVIADDVMAVQMDMNYHVIPAYPSVKLFPHTAKFFGREMSTTETLYPQSEKQRHSVALRFPQTPVPLCRMYVLAGGGLESIEPLQPREAFPQLVRNSRAVTLLRDPEFRTAHLQQCAKLAAGVPVCRLRRRLVLSAVRDLVKLIEEDLAYNI